LEEYAKNRESMGKSQEMKVGTYIIEVRRSQTRENLKKVLPFVDAKRYMSFHNFTSKEILKKKYLSHYNNKVLLEHNF